MLTDPAREVVHLFVHDSPAVGGRVVFFNLFDLDLFNGVGICIDGGWGNKTDGNEKRNDQCDEFGFHVGIMPPFSRVVQRKFKIE